MTKLTLKHIKDAVSKDQRIDPVMDFDEAGKAIIYTNDGWTWCAADGNRHVEGFVYSDDCVDERDTVGYFRERLSMIEKEVL